jgi:hypothetical protein
MAYAPSTEQDPQAGDLSELVVHIAGSDEEAPIARLAQRAGSPRPSGALLVAALGGDILAAGSISSGELLREPTQAGAAAAAVVGHRLSEMARPHRPPRRSGSPS